MKRFVLVAMLFVAAACAPLDAQAVGDLYFKVPFNFRVGTVVMPAGDYVIHQSQTLLTISRAGGPGIFTMTLQASRKAVSEAGTLDFVRYGDTYFLSAVWSPDSSKGLALFKGPLEKQLARRAVPVETALQAK